MSCLTLVYFYFFALSFGVPWIEFNNNKKHASNSLITSTFWVPLSFHCRAELNCLISKCLNKFSSKKEFQSVTYHHYIRCHRIHYCIRYCIHHCVQRYTHVLIETREKFAKWLESRFLIKTYLLLPCPFPLCPCPLALPFCTTTTSCPNFSQTIWWAQILVSSYESLNIKLPPP